MNDRADERSGAPPVVPPPPATRPAAGLVFDPRHRSPLLAAVLSAVPGLGQVYSGYYQRGFVHILVIGSLISLMASGAMDPLLPLMGLFLAFFWLYNMVDAARRATFYNEALAGRAQIDLPRDFPTPGLHGSLVGGVTLVVFGAVLLSNTLFRVPLDWLEDWWPVVLIGFGLYLAYKGLRERASAAAPEEPGG